MRSKDRIKRAERLARQLTELREEAAADDGLTFLTYLIAMAAEEASSVASKLGKAARRPALNRVTVLGPDVSGSPSCPSGG